MAETRRIIDWGALARYLAERLATDGEPDERSVFAFLDHYSDDETALFVREMNEIAREVGRGRASADELEAYVDGWRQRAGMDEGALDAELERTAAELEERGAAA